jgi:hypothetical protein
MWNTKSICLFLLGFIGVGTVEGQTSVDSYEYSSYVDPRTVPRDWDVYLSDRRARMAW